MTPVSSLPTLRICLIASAAIKVPTTPGSGENTPASAHVGAKPSAGFSGKTHGHIQLVIKNHDLPLQLAQCTRNNYF